MLKKYKKHHIAFAIWIIVFKILVIGSLIYIAFTLVEIEVNLENTRENQKKLEEQISLNQKGLQSQINEISSSLLIVKKDLGEEISEIKASSSADFSLIIEDVIPSIVSVATDVSQGSGFIITSEGHIITNAHVLEGARYAKVLLYGADEWVLTELVGYDLDLDVAVLKIQGSGHDYLEFDDSDNVRVGEKVIALGNPLGLSFSVTEGIVSGLKREGPNDLPAYIQIDVPLNQGNSGGPLVNKKGKVIGINNFKIQGSENLGFALESNYVVDSINSILNLNNTILEI